MMDVYVAIGSNIEPEVMLRRAAVLLRETFSTVNFSPVYRNPSVGFDGDDFLNAVGHFITDMSADGVDKELKAMQFALDPRSAKPTNCKIDLDLVLYGDECCEVRGKAIPSPDIIAQAYVLKPLQDSCPAGVHPVVKKTYRALWDAVTQESHPLHKIDFNWE